MGLVGCTGFYRVLPGFTEFSKFFQARTLKLENFYLSEEFRSVYPSFKRFEWVVPGFTGFYWVLPSFQSSFEHRP